MDLYKKKTTLKANRSEINWGVQWATEGYLGSLSRITHSRVFYGGREYFQATKFFKLLPDLYNNINSPPASARLLSCYVESCPLFLGECLNP